MSPAAQGTDRLEQKLDNIIELLKYMIVLQLAEKKVPHQTIGKHVHLAKATVGQMLKGVKGDG
jgi:hypothetical protein